ncbi:hypothetical protein [Achromobacter agilis]|uniref:Uncharacterized protein n=1 Tax=Achromobacter agilis TaxID=1353888 RepID=A0A446CQE0_9BURK|nr:hypothetical protein [Achromobacter agilis]SSW69991.1 hypothetical protein AGI3411_04441 [Achromobacter agilis]
MTNVIAQLASVKLPTGLLDQVDINEVYERFRTTFNRLDDLKKARDRHEQRGFLGRLFNGSELKSAQLDAQEVQAEFSKTLAQLMMITTLQSQQLVDQQQLLHRQQEDLKSKARSLAEHNARLEQHQAEIKEQSTEVKRLVEGLLTVNGLTEEHAEQLIQVAEDVFNTKQSMLEQVDQQRSEIENALAQTNERLSANLQALRAEGQARHGELQTRLDTHQQLSDRKQQQIQQEWAERHQAMQHAASTLRTSVDQRLAQAETHTTQRLDKETGHRTEGAAALNAALNSLQAQHVESEIRHRHQLRRLKLALGVITLCAAGLFTYGHQRLNAMNAAQPMSTTPSHQPSHSQTPAPFEGSRP